MAEFKNNYGSVKVYTRHIPTCKYSDTSHHKCHCPKWAYVRDAATGERMSRAD
jgi:hypothetical protein